MLYFLQSLTPALDFRWPNLSEGDRNVPRCASIRFPRRRTAVTSVVLMLASLLTVTILAGCGGDTTERPKYEAVTGGSMTGPAKPKDPISKEAVEKIVTRKLGDAGIAGQPVLRQLTLTPEAGGTFVDIQLNRTASCHPGQLVGTAVSMSQNVMSAVFRYPDVARVQLTLFGTTESIEDKDKAAVRILVTKDVAANLDWFQFTDANVEKLAAEFWAEPGIYANWKVYGGGAITDEAQRAAANAGVTTPAPTTATTPATP